MHCSFCRITGQSHNLPKPNYPPLIPLPQHLDGGASGCFMGVNEKRVQFCKITSEIDYQRHHYVPSTSPSDTEIWARRGSGSPCRVMGKSRSMEWHHFTPSYQDLAAFSHVEGCKITQKNRSLQDYRYVYPCVLLGPEDRGRSNAEAEDEVMREMQFSMSYMHHFIEGYEYVCPHFSSNEERVKCLSQLRKKLGISARDENATPSTKHGHKYVYSVCDDLCSLVVPSDIEDILRLGKVDNIWLTADRKEMVLELNRSGTLRKSTVTLSLETEVLTSEELHEDLEGKNLLPGVAGGSHAIRLMEEQKKLKKTKKKKKIKSQSLKNPIVNVENTDQVESKNDTHNGESNVKINKIDNQQNSNLERPNTLATNKCNSGYLNGTSDESSMVRLIAASPELDSTSGTSSNSSPCTSPCGHSGWPSATMVNIPQSPNAKTTRCVLIKGPDWEDIKRAAQEEWLDEIKMEQVEHIIEETISSTVSKEVNDDEKTNKSKLTNGNCASRNSFESVEEQSSTSGGSDETLTEMEIFVTGANHNYQQENLHNVSGKSNTAQSYFDDYINPLNDGQYLSENNLQTNLNNLEYDNYVNNNNNEEFSNSIKNMFTKTLENSYNLLSEIQTSDWSNEHIEHTEKVKYDSSNLEIHSSDCSMLNEQISRTGNTNTCSKPNIPMNDSPHKIEGYPEIIKSSSSETSNLDSAHQKIDEIGDQLCDNKLLSVISETPTVIPSDASKIVERIDTPEGNSDSKLDAFLIKSDLFAKTINNENNDSVCIEKLNQVCHSIDDISDVCGFQINNNVFVNNGIGLTANLTTTNAISTEMSANLSFSSIQVANQLTMNEVVSNNVTVTRSPRVRFRHPETEEIPDVDHYIEKNELNSRLRDELESRMCPTPKIGNVPVTLLTSEDNEDESDNEINDQPIKINGSKYKKESNNGINSDDDEISGVVSKILRDHTVGLNKSFRERYRLSSLEDDDDDSFRLSSKLPSDTLSSRRSDKSNDNEDIELSTNIRSLKPPKTLFVKEDDDDDDDDYYTRKNRKQNACTNGAVSLDELAKQMAISIKMAGHTPPLRLRDLIEQYVVTKDYSPKSTDVGSIVLREGQIVEIIDSESDKDRWLVRTRPSKYLSPRQGWIPVSYLEKKSTDPNYISILNDDYELRTDSKEREAALKRRNVVKELVETEEEFVSDMQHVVHTYLREMDNPRMPKELRDFKDDIFHSFKEICEFHNNVLIKGVQYYAGEPTKLGKTFLRLERDFDMHANYCQQEPQAQELLSTLPVREYFEEYSKRIGEVDRSLSDHLKLPIQRINDYQLLLKELIKYTARLKEDCTDLQKALDLMQGIPQRASDLKLTSNILGFKGNIHKLGRLLRHQDWFTVTDNGGRNKERYLFLFKSRIFVTKVRRLSEDKSSYILKDIIKLSDVEVIDNGNDKQFEIHLKSDVKAVGSTRYPLILEAQSEEVKEAWFKELGSVKQDFALITDVSEEGIVEDCTEDKSSEGILEEEVAKSEVEIREATPEIIEEPIVIDQPPTENILIKELDKDSRKRNIEEPIVIDQPPTENILIKELDKDSRKRNIEEPIVIDQPPTKNILIKELDKDSRKRNIEEPIVIDQPPTKNILIKELDKDSRKRNIEEEKIVDYQEVVEVEEKRSKVEILENFQAYEELNTVMTDSIKSGSITSLDECVSLASSHSEESSIYLTANEFEDGTSRPRFHKFLKGQTCLRGETVTMECEPISVPPATVAWLKDNIPLTKSQKIQFTTKGNSQFLVIKDTQIEDSGVYSCKATNKNGSAASSAQLHILDPEEIKSNPSTPEPKKPEFTIKFKDTELLEGTSVRFLVKVRANPDPVLKFFKNDKPLKEDDRIKLFAEDKGTYELSIAHVTANDAGKYTCKAKNNLGESEFSAAVKVTNEKELFHGVQDVPVQNGSSPHPGDQPDFKWFRDGLECEASERFKVLFKDEEDTLALVFQHVKPEDAGLYTCVASTTSGRISCSAELSVEGSVSQLMRDPEPPKITAELSDVEVGQGTSAMLELKVTGYPKPAIAWSKDGNEIKAGSKYKVLHEDDENMALIIKNIASEDAGKYTVKAKNPLGEVASSAKVVVKAPPKFIKTLEGAKVMAEQAIKFDVEIEGDPKPEVVWYKDGQVVKENERIKITESSKTQSYSLEIKKSRSEDAGSYSCVATNSSGKISEFAHVTVNEAPKFLKEIKSVEIREFDSVKFEVKVAGQPEPSVKWMKGNVEIKEDGKRIKFERDDRNYTLIIEKASRSDADKYSCVIKNEFGESTGTGNLTVNSSPEYVEKLNNMTVKEGEVDYKLKVKVSGFPEPKIRWFIESMEIDEKSNRYKIVDDGETKVLVIKKVDAECSGSYSCKISNSNGEASCEGSLNVLTKPRFVEGLSDLEKTEEESVSLTVKVTGNPSPSLKWYKDNEEVSVSATVKVLKVIDGCSTLDITKLVEEAAGTYECHASNTEGDAVTVSKLIVNKKIESSSESKENLVNDVNESELKDDQISRQCSNEENIKKVEKQKHTFKKESYDYVEEFLNKCSSIIVQNLDDKEFQLKAEISTEEIITIVDDDQNVIQRDVTYSVEEIDMNKLKENLLNITGDSDIFADAILTKKQKPKDDGELNIAIGENVLDPKEENCECDVQKFVIETSDSIQESVEPIKNIVNQEPLQLFGSEIVTNQTAELDSPRMMDHDESAANPKFIGSMESVEVWSGEDAVIECKGISIPYPEVKWFRNGELLEDDSRIKIKSDGDKHEVSITNTAVEDSGAYKCVLSNKIGSAELEGKLNVKASAEANVPVLLKKLEDIVCIMGENGSFQAKIYANPEPEIKWYRDGVLLEGDRYVTHNNNITHFFDLSVKNVTPSDIGKYTVVADNGNGKVSSEASMDVNVPPVIQEIKDKKAMPESSVTFETKVTGKPMPAVKWVKGTKELTAENNAEFEADEATGVYKLKLKKLTPESSGAYACIATNVAAEAKQPFNLTVTTEAPHFIKGLQNKGCKLDGQLKIDVQVYGLPMPLVKWFKDKNELTESDKIKFVQNDERNFSLIIEQFVASDAGKYTCKAINQAGEAVSQAEYSLHHGLPEFVKQLPKEVCVMDGEALVLEAKVDTHPMPEIKWLKDGKEIIPDEHIRIEALPDGTVKLSMDSAVPEDKGKFTLLAINDAGQTPSTGQVVVEAMPKAPQILKNLENQDVPLGSQLKLAAKVTAYPKPTVKWLKDGKPLKLDNRVRLVQHNGTLGLEIDDVRPEDEGKYTLQVSNHRGEASSSCDVTAKSATAAPEVLQPLKPINATEGTPCRLEAKVAGIPLPTCNWFKDGVPITPDDKSIKSTIKPDGSVALLFDKCALGDAGKYTLEVVNPYGSSKCDGNLNIAGRDQPNENKKAPTFTLPLRDVEIDEGKPLKLTAQIEGNPYPDISWTKDDLPLRLGNNLSMYCDGNKINLEIPKSSPKDSGRYECKLSSPEGNASSKCGVNVRKIYSPPIFTQKPSDLFTILGGDPRFICRVGGIPKPDVTWFFNDHPLHDSPKYKIRRDGDLCALQIKATTPEDKGRYKCRISNDAGEDHAFANLDIGDSYDRKDKFEAPSFLKKLGDCSIMEGMSAKFTACVAGIPEPEFRWYLNGSELKDTDRIKSQVEPHGLLRLLVKSAKPEDVGSYTLKIWNPHGEIESTAQLIFDQFEEKKLRKPKPELNLDLNKVPLPTPTGDDQSKAKPPKSDNDDGKVRGKMADLNIDREKFRRQAIPFALTDKPIISKMTDRRLTLSWKPSIPRGPSVPVTYIVEMCEVPEGDWISSRSGIRGCCCEIRNLEPFRDYKFRVRVENKYGISDPSPYALTFRQRLEMTPPRYLPRLPPEIDFRPETSPYFPRDYDIDRPLHEEYAHAPKFLRQIDDIQYGVKGEPCTVEWYVYGFPVPTVEFTRNGQKIEIKDRYESAVARNGQCKLYISRMFDHDVGEYECIAINEHGEARQRINLAIAEHPVFIMPLDEESILIRKSGYLQCRVVGKPYPEIKWYKDWRPLASSSRIKIEWKEPDLCTLYIDDTISKDGGLYSCCARNIAGMATSSAMLTIEEDENDYALIKYSHARDIRARPKAMEDFYDIGDELGRGTQGIVYHAVERSTGNSYAAKCMHGKGDIKKLMHQELDIMNQLHDRYLIRARDAFETKNAVTILTDLAAGGELFDTICKQTTITESEIANFIRQILWGLDHMHNKGIAHLGLSPADILLSKPGGDDIKVCDFGLARRILKNKDIYQEFGMPEFVAPEIINHRPVGYPTDMWSVGVITYLLLSGISPFLGETDRETLKRIQAGQLTFDQDVFTNLSDEAKDFISKLLIFDSQGRMDVKAALSHPWLRYADRPGSGNTLSTDRLRDYYRRYKDWIRNSACDRFYRRRPLTYAFDHPSGMVYPPGEKYTPASSPESSPTTIIPKPEFEPPKYVDHVNENDREPINYDLGYADSNSRYQNGPDTYLLQLRDVNFPLRLREYMRVAGCASPSLGLRLQDTLSGQMVTVRERRRFTDVMDEEIDDEKKGQLDGVRRRISSEVSQRAETKNRIKELLPREEEKSPYFREKIRDTALTEGNVVEFSCLAIGEPKPVITWYRNDVVMTETHRVKIIDESGRSILRFNTAKTFDAGFYKVVARNVAGEVVCRARLKQGELPGKADALEVAQVSDTEALITWHYPKADGNSPVICYCLEFKESDEPTWREVRNNIDHQSFVVRSLSPKTKYSFRLRAQNQFGWGDYSNSLDNIETLDAGSPKVSISCAMKHQQELTESNQNNVSLEQESRKRPLLDYSKERNPVPMAENNPADKYRFLTEISKGKFSVTVKCCLKEDPEKLFAAKLLQWSSAAEQEYDVIKSLSHEGVAALESAHHFGNMCILVMEKLQGCDVITYLTRGKDYTEDVVARITAQVLDALEYLHFRRILHLDVQPDNVVVSDLNSATVKLVDFGSAQSIANYVPSKLENKDNVDFLAPEVLNGEDLSAHADIWSLGVLTYILLSGVSPFKGETTKETISNINYVRYRFENLHKEITQESQRFLMAIFKKTPIKRPTADECQELKWLTPSEYMLKKREKAIFNSEPLKVYNEEYRRQKQTAAKNSEGLMNAFGMQLSRSVSVEYQTMTTF